MDIYVDRITGKVKPSQSPLTYTIEVPDGFTINKTIEVQQGGKQKTNEQGQLLYKVNVVKDAAGKETFEETIESKTITKTEPRDTVIKWIDEDSKEQAKTVTIEEPIEWTDNEPVMIPSMIQKSVNFKDNPGEFTAVELLGTKYQHLLEESMYDRIIASAFLSETDIDVTAPEHSANTGIALLQLLPKGQAITKDIVLDKPATNFAILEFTAAEGVELYLSDNKFVNGKISLTTPLEKCKIKIVSTLDKPVQVKSYAIAY